MFYSKKSTSSGKKEAQDSSAETARPKATNMNPNGAHGLGMQPQSKVEPSVISAGAVFHGNISSPGPIHAQGVIEGELDAPRVTLGKKGRVVGKITCEQLVIDGAFSGDLQCKEIAAGARASLEGNISCDSLTVTPGASINGDLRVGKR